MTLTRPTHDSPRLGMSFWLAIVALIATRLWLWTSFQPLENGDTLIYFRYAVDGVDLGEVPYRDTDIEYPPLAWWTIAAPRWLAAAPIYRAYLTIGGGDLSDFQVDYFRKLRALLTGFDLASFALLSWIVYRRRCEALTAIAWSYVGITGLLPHVLYERLDIVLLFWLLAWAAAWTKAETTDSPTIWKWLAYVALGLGISFKLIPLVIVPACLSADLRQAIKLHQWRALAVSCVVLGLAALGPFVYYHFASGPGVWRMFGYHGERGIEIEALFASLQFPLRYLGLDLAVSHGFGSINLDSSLSPALAKLSSVLLLGVLGGSAWLSWRDATQRERAFAWGLAALLASVLVAKVLSVQYMLWTLPLLVLLASETLDRRRLHTVIGIAITSAALSTVIYPYLFFPNSAWNLGTVDEPWTLTPVLHWLPCGVLFVRNALLVARVAIAIRPLFVRRESR